MRVKFAIATLLVFAIAVGVAYADSVVNLPLSSLTTYGWKATAKSSSIEPGASVSEKLNFAGANGFQMSPKKNAYNDQSWAGVSTGAYAGVSLSSITKLDIRTYGIEGDGTTWQPTTFMFWVYKAPTNLSLRNLTWIPWTNGNPRSPGAWNIYDALTTGTWICSWTGASYTSWAAVLAGIPSGFLMTDAQAAAAGAYSGQAFNVASGSWINEENQYFSSARGVVDWVEVGVNGVNTKYDFAEPVPEPASVATLALGLVGLVGWRRRK